MSDRFRKRPGVNTARDARVFETIVLSLVLVLVAFARCAV